MLIENRPIFYLKSAPPLFFAKVHYCIKYFYPLIVFCVSLSLYDCPLIFSRKALCVNLSTIAATSTLSLMISFHLLKARLVVIIVAFFPDLSDR